MKKIKTIESATLKNWMLEGKDLQILDIRPDKEREEWQIPGSVHFNIYDKLKAGDREAFDAIQNLNLIPNQPVVAVCMGGKMSQLATELLEEKGFDAYSLEGGMKGWNFAWDTSEVVYEQATIVQVRRLAKGCLSYIIGSGSEAMVIDASLNPEIYIAIAKEKGWNIGLVADTHIHADFVSRTAELAKSTGAKHVMIDKAEVSFPFNTVNHGDEIHLGKSTIKVLHTPGHTWESTCFLLNDKVIFTGDTLFTDGIGRPDLKADEEEVRKKSAALYESLHNILALDGEMVVMPAHISKSLQVGEGYIKAPLKDLKESIEVLSLSKSSFIESILSKLPDSPPNYMTIAGINKSGNYSDIVLADLEAGANRCAIK